MTTSNRSCPTPDGDRFTSNEVKADAHNAGYVREQFADWLRQCTELDETRFSDVVLAVNEALANAAEFAYLHAGGTGTIDVDAVRHRDASTLTVTVADQGSWRNPDPARQGRTRGRGIPLMRALADEVTIDTSALGTTVCLRFDNVHAVQKADAAVR